MTRPFIGLAMACLESAVEVWGEDPNLRDLVHREHVRARGAADRLGIRGVVDAETRALVGRHVRAAAARSHPARSRYAINDVGDASRSRNVAELLRLGERLQLL